MITDFSFMAVTGILTKVFFFFTRYGVSFQHFLSCCNFVATHFAVNILKNFLRVWVSFDICKTNLQ